MSNLSLYRRSIYIEILSVNENGEAGVMQESFAFTIPPQNIDTTYTQRTTITPTVGGNFVDRYGLGNAKISILGETGNEDSRITILGRGKTPQLLTGQQSWFEFKERIVFYSNKKTNFIMRYYDLTHKGSSAKISGVSGYSEAWEVVLQDVNSMRSYTKPFFYPYKIQLEGVRPLGSYNPKSATSRIGLISNIKGLIETVSDSVLIFTEGLEVFLSDNFEYLNDIADLLESTNIFLTRLESLGDLVLEYEQKIGGLFTEVLSQTEDTLTAGVQLISYPYLAVETAKDQINDVKTKAHKLSNTARQAGKAVLSMYDWDSETDPVSEIDENLLSVENTFNEIVQISKQGASDEPIGAVSINDAVVLFYGYEPAIAQANTRLDSLAKDYYGDADYKDLISVVNSVYTVDDIIPGQTLLLPTLSPQTRISNNFIYASPEKKDDVLGVDVLVNKYGMISLEDNDYAVVSGDNNVYQAVHFRLSESRDRQLRSNTYGVVADIGEALNSEASFEFIAISLKETLISDPRIINVYGLNYEYSGDILYQEFSYDTITKLNQLYRGEI